jgi:hypothetical protein
MGLLLPLRPLPIPLPRHGCQVLAGVRVCPPVPMQTLFSPTRMLFHASGTSVPFFVAMAYGETDCAEAAPADMSVVSETRHGSAVVGTSGPCAPDSPLPCASPEP